MNHGLFLYLIFFARYHNTVIIFPINYEVFVGSVISYVYSVRLLLKFKGKKYWLELHMKP